MSRRPELADGQDTAGGAHHRRQLTHRTRHLEGTTWGVSGLSTLLQMKAIFPAQ
jgi:hypothetical protein